MRAIALLIGLLILATAAVVNEPAPYTAEANERITRIQRKMQAPDIATSDRQKNVANYLDYHNKLYKRADYDFPKSLAEYYLDAAERNGLPEKRREAKLIADTAATLHSLTEGMTAENAFPGNDYEVVRLVFKRLRAAEQGLKLSDEEITRSKQFRVDAENARNEKLQKAESERSFMNIAFQVGLAFVTACVIGFLLWPVQMYFRRKKLAAMERAAPYVYIKKHGHYPEMQNKDK